MILTLTASIMYWSLQRGGDSEAPSAEGSVDGEDERTLSDDLGNLTTEDAATDPTVSPQPATGESSQGIESMEPSADIQDKSAADEACPAVEKEKPGTE